MKFDFQPCRRAPQSCVLRCDGRLFIGETRTDILRRLFPSAAAAMAAGLRPQSAPHSPAQNGVKTTVSRALKPIEQEAPEQHSVSRLAQRPGVGEWYLRRLLAAPVDAGPMAVPRSRRAWLARKLIVGGVRPMAGTAHAAGFCNIRRCNGTFHKLYSAPPPALRKGCSGSGAVASQPCTRS